MKVLDHKNSEYAVWNFSICETSRFIADSRVAIYNSG